MKRFKKKLIAATAGICLTMGLSISSVAAESMFNPIMPRAQECGNCGQYGVSTSVSYSSWVENSNKTPTCKKYVTKKDKVEERDVYTEYNCRYCGYHKIITTEMERVVCNH